MHVSYRYLLIIVLVAALLCLMPARGADAPNEKKPQTAAAQSVESAEAPAGADLSAQTNRETYLHRTLYYAPCGHSVQRREKLPAQLVGLTRGALALHSVSSIAVQIAPPSQRPACMRSNEGTPK